MADPPLTQIVHLLRGQLTIPDEFRRRLGISDDTPLQLTLHEGKIEIVPVNATPVAGMAWVRKLHAMFASIRQKADDGRGRNGRPD